MDITLDNDGAWSVTQGGVIVATIPPIQAFTIAAATVARAAGLHVSAPAPQANEPHPVEPLQLVRG